MIPDEPEIMSLLPLLPLRYLAVQLRFDRESFAALKELLREQSMPPGIHYENGVKRNGACEESPRSRMAREALQRVYAQIRDMRYPE